MHSLPLSWSLNDNPPFNSVIVNNRNFSWQAIHNLPNIDLGKLDIQKTPVIIRGCNTELKYLFEKKGFVSTQSGIEAVLETNKDHFKKKSLQNLVKRGLKNGNVIEVPYSELNSKKLTSFRKECVHGSGSQLKNLFQMEFLPHNILYVFTDSNDKWLAAILLSKNSKSKLHTELLLRRKNTPNGIMEALIEEAFANAKKEGFSEFSLGEVPFIGNNWKKSDFVTKIIMTSGKLLKFAYNYKGLYRFKNKFQPKWGEVYICSSSQNRIKQHLFLFIYSNFYSLIIKKMISFLKNLISRNYLLKNGFFNLR